MRIKKNKLLEFKSLIVGSYQSGATLRDIAKVYECSTGTIRNVLLKEKCTMRGKGRIKKGEVKNGV